MKFDYSKTINEQLDTFDYYKNRYANYELTILKLQRENNDLKKQLEKKYEKVGTLTAEILYEENTRLANEITVLKTENQKSKEMQREFIDWLGSLVVSNLDVFTEIKVCDFLSKYKEIIGEKDE